MITKINTNIPNKTNIRIIEILSCAGGWTFGVDNKKFNLLSHKDSGFMLNTYKEDQINAHDILNCLANLIYDVVESKCFFTFKKICRVYWNWYHPGSLMQFHDDSKLDNKYSILYNLHNNDGGTEFKINDKLKFFKSNESEAILFPSKIEHRGIAPKVNPNRFCLNITLEI